MINNGINQFVLVGQALTKKKRAKWTNEDLSPSSLMMPDISQGGGAAWLWAPCYKSESCFSCWVRMAMWSFWCFPTRMCSTTWSCEFVLERDYSLASPTPIFAPKAMWHHVKPCGTMSSHVKHMEPPIYWSCNQVLLTLWSRSITDDLLPLQGNLTLAYHTHACTCIHRCVSTCRVLFTDNITVHILIGMKSIHLKSQTQNCSLACAADHCSF